MFDATQIQELINIAITAVLIPILLAVSGYIVGWFKAKTEQLKQGTKNQEIYKYIDILDKTVYEVVYGLQEQIVDDLKREAKEGKLSVEDIAMIRDKCIKNITTILGDNALIVLETVYGDVRKAIDIKIYKEVKEMKEGAE